MEGVMQIFYDQKGDVLYISVGEPRAAISDEVSDEVLVRRDIDTGEVVGVTLMNFSENFTSVNVPHEIPVCVNLSDPPTKP